MNQTIRKYRFFLGVILVMGMSLLISPQIGHDAVGFIGKSFLTFLVLLPPIFLGIGLLDVWVKRDDMIRIMGAQSGLRGIGLAFLVGIVTAIPIYAIFPIAGLMVKKGCRIANVLIFICSSASLRIPLLFFEVSSLGWQFMLARCFSNMLIVLIIAQVIEHILTEQEKQNIYANAGDLS